MDDGKGILAPGVLIIGGKGLGYEALTVVYDGALALAMEEG